MHADVGSSAGAGGIVKVGDIAGSVADKRESFLVDAGEYQLALLAGREHLAGVRVNDLGDKVVFIDVHALLFIALEGDAGTADFRKSVDIVGFETEFVFDITAHFLRPGFRAEDTGLQVDLIPLTALMNGFREVGGVAGGAAENGGTEIRHELDLAVCITGRHGKSQRPQLVGTAVETCAAGEEAVAVADLNYIVRGCARCHQGSGAALVPHVDVILGVESDNPAARGAAGGLNADTVA